MLYVVRYRKLGGFFWRKLGKIKADLNTMNEGLPVRVFILDDDTRIEIPALAFEFRFSPERHLLIVKKMEQEAGQKLPIN